MKKRKFETTSAVRGAVVELIGDEITNDELEYRSIIVCTKDSDCPSGKKCVQQAFKKRCV